ncbi:barstar family protein [Chondromyces crocatus]|uniref:Barstar (barnase inhibitor) domain-containing protein n=1 Tax=Chondromyces crocatus TaxID=52 RepID=A0A0K1ECX7_CHOCO|nr:barstar family protein [Chondromyces crocatus]AKT38694.1 uncharacterized protein CMC5_028420 [Chondromyces crocatus]
MSRQQQVFEFGTGASKAGDFVAEVPTGLSSVEALLASLYEALRLPGYFGFNWDALSDCLRDLHWLAAHEVVLVHRDLPAIAPAELHTYVEVLAEAVRSWKPGEAHMLRVVFPAAARDRVLALLDAKPPAKGSPGASSA